MYWSICPPSLVVTRHWWHTSRASRPISQPPGRRFGIVGISKTWCFWGWLGRSIQGFCLSGHKEYFLDNLPFLTPLFATIFASIPLVSFHMRSGSMIFASFACFPRIRKKWEWWTFTRILRFEREKSTIFRVYDRGFTSSKRHFYWCFTSYCPCLFCATYW